MAKVSPFHSRHLDTEVYHNNNNCTVGNSIESYNKVSGAGGLRLCSACKDLFARGAGSHFPPTFPAPISN